MESYFDYCKQHLLERLDAYIGTSHYTCDLGYYLCEEENANGSLTFSRDRAMKYLQAWWFDCGDYWEYEKDNFGEHPHNPFDNPEAFMVCMVIHGVDNILSQLRPINEAWNDTITLSNEFIAELKKEIEEVTDILW
jgi:hypothetical protein